MTKHYSDFKSLFDLLICYFIFVFVIFFIFIYYGVVLSYCSFKYSVSTWSLLFIFLFIFLLSKFIQSYYLLFQAKVQFTNSIGTLVVVKNFYGISFLILFCCLYNNCDHLMAVLPLVYYWIYIWKWVVETCPPWKRLLFYSCKKLSSLW